MQEGHSSPVFATGGSSTVGDEGELEVVGATGVACSNCGGRGRPRTPHPQINPAKLIANIVFIKLKTECPVNPAPYEQFLQMRYQYYCLDQQAEKELRRKFLL